MQGHASPAVGPKLDSRHCLSSQDVPAPALSGSKPRSSASASRRGPDVSPMAPAVPALPAGPALPAVPAAPAPPAVPGSRQHDKPIASASDQARQSTAPAIHHAKTMPVSTVQREALQLQPPATAATAAADVSAVANTAQEPNDQLTGNGQIANQMLVSNPRASDVSEMRHVMLRWQWGKHSSVAAEFGLTAHVWRAPHMGRRWPAGDCQPCSVALHCIAST